ncbi:hypothetical protein E3U43_008621 [Larimichthys crocea]|uniref:Uncharacterized protein n=1 Tax=Larimichthys crocea TaxID=215358 RepID=A0ACD3RVA1_LARCR|nr:hypothetical protein E3U43_008621 [Larimichthys crocea]
MSRNNSWLHTHTETHTHTERERDSREQAEHQHSSAACLHSVHLRPSDCRFAVRKTKTPAATPTDFHTAQGACSDRLTVQLFYSGTQETLKGFQDDDFMERQTAELCRPACQHGRADDEEIQKRAIPPSVCQQKLGNGED